MGYRPLAELYSSHRIPTAPFGIEMGEIPPGSPQAPQRLAALTELLFIIISYLEWLLLLRFGSYEVRNDRRLVAYME